jgi:CHAT domain-containing protein
MQHFYAHWRGGTAATAVAALNAAKREFRAKYPHPFFWAPFQLVGSAT